MSEEEHSRGTENNAVVRFQLDWIQVLYFCAVNPDELASSLRAGFERSTCIVGLKHSVFWLDTNLREGDMRIF